MAEQQPKPQHSLPQTPAQRAFSLAKAIWRRIENIVFGFMLLLITLYLVLQMPAVQNWLVRKATAFFSEELHTRVEIRRVNISFFDNLVLEGFYVEDLKGDTLLYAGELTAGLNSNIFSLLSNKLEFNEISLTKARFNMLRPIGAYDYNLQFLLDYFSKPPNTPPKKPSPFSVRIQNLRLRDVEFLKDDQKSGQKMLFRVSTATIRVNNLDIPSKIADIRSADFNGFTFAVVDGLAHPLPERAPPLAKTISASIDTIDLAQPVKPFEFAIGRFSLTEGRFLLDKFGNSPNFVSLPDVMDYNHLRVHDISLQADSVAFTDDLVFSGTLRNLSAKERCGFELSHLEANKVIVSDKLTGLYGAKLQTPFSSLGDTIAFHYSRYQAYKQFNDSVSMELRLAKGSKVLIGDINYFSEGLANNKFFLQNSDELAELSGTVTGTINKLRGRDLDIKIDANTYMKGNFIGDELAGNKDLMKLGFKFEALHSDFRTISRIIPGFSAPEYFYRLGNIGYEGNYDVIFGNIHILYGNITTDIGAGHLDMELDLSKGKDEATYAGNLYMKEFDLATWTGNRDFGKTTFRVKIEEPSKGLSLRTMNTILEGSVDTFFFRGYNYQNVSLKGQFQNYVFHGDLGLDDDNIKFGFKGDIDMKDSITLFDFKANLRRLDLGALHLLDEDWILSGDIERINLHARTLDDLTGTVLLRNFMILQDHETTHRIDSLIFISDYNPDGAHIFRINSDIADAEMIGKFSLPRLPANLMQVFSRQHPGFAAQLGLAPADSSVLTDNFSMNIRIKDSHALTRLFIPQLDTLRNIEASARVDAERGYTQLIVLAPYIDYDGTKFRDVGLYWHGEPDTSYYDFSIPQTVLSSRSLAPIGLSGYLTETEMGFTLKAKDSTSIVENINLDGVLTTVDSLWQIRFNASEIALFKSRWYMDEDNYIRFGKDFFEPRNFDLMSDNLRINLDGANNNHGLRLSTANFDLNFLNGFVRDSTLKIRGRIASIDLTILDLYQLQGIEANIDVEELFLKEKTYGSFYGFAQMANLEAPVEWRFVTQKGIEQPTMRVAGGWLPGGKDPQPLANYPDIKVKPTEFYASVLTNGFPLVVLETFVPGISKTSGLLNAEATLGGTFNRIVVNGEARIPEGQFQMDYLKTMYHLRNQKIELSEYRIWADGDTIMDVSGNIAIIEGGLIHDHFKSWSVDCSIESVNSNFMILNTLPEDNELYYGQGIGKFKATFSGSFSRTNILIDATTGRDTRLYIPVSSATDVSKANFITFKSKTTSDTTKNKTNSFNADEVKGLNLEMNLSVTEDAEVQLIFDEKAGDIIKGRGEGDITLTMNREGEFKMYGSYRIKRGEYLFTLLNWVNKPFTVTEGGTVNWYGDPYGAQISLDATYSTNTSLYNFLRDEVELIPSVTGEATKATKVVVTMHLKGDLLRPNITFDMDFPNISSQLKSLADNRLRLIRLDQNELNRQVFGLVVVGSFLPANSGGFIQNSDYLTSAFNTLTQVLSNQLSNYLTGLAAEWFGGAVSSIDFDIAYSEYQNALLDPGQNNISQIGRELQVRLTSGFANDRVTIQFGSQFGLGRPGTTVQDGFLGEDVTVEVQLTENRQWRLKVYQRTEPDIAGSQRRARYGFGISFRKDYDSFDDMMSGLTGWFRKKS